ncbi:cation:proton antiporter [Actinomadura latina]|uniref:Cation:proton antiporter n=1 Tax=Actinomadura latina TaxID=163603 RepID=A0A846YZ34_9ACTN|nr:cation:proton antiporter [Actinomadura latina]NKZ03728.1 cation:proton antiporter [Actinomadura latina]
MGAAPATGPVAPLASHGLLIFLLQVAVLLTLALVLGRLATRVGMPAVVGELAAGVLLGPSLFGQVAPDAAGWLIPAEPGQFHLLDAFGEIGVLLLVAIAGIQMDLGLVRRRGLDAARIGLAGLLIPLGLGICCGLLLPASLFAAGADRTAAALFLGIAMCMSAIPVIAKTLMDMNLLHRNIGQLTLTAGMIDNTAGWLLLSIASAMTSVGVGTGTVATAVGEVVLVLLLAAAARPLARLVLGRIHEPAVTVSTVTIMVLLAAAGTQALGLEPLFGAFLCGLVIAAAGNVDVAGLAPLRMLVLAFLAPVFFATAGLRMDLTALGRPVVLLTALVVLLVAVAGKFTGAILGARLSGLNRWEALALGAGMNARGAVEIIVAMAGLRLGILNTATYTIIVLVAIVTSLLAPPILRPAMARVERTPEERQREDAFA